MRPKLKIGPSTHPREYRSWVGLRERCLNKNHHAFADYGGRGIAVCDRWAGRDCFANFFNDMGQRPVGFSIDRIDVDGDYSPENCRWSSKKEQSRNRRNTIYVEYRGKTVSISEAIEDSGLYPALVHSRIRLGWPESRLFIPALVR